MKNTEGKFQNKHMKTEVHSNSNYEEKVGRIMRHFKTVFKGTQLNAKWKKKPSLILNTNRTACIHSN